MRWFFLWALWFITFENAVAQYKSIQKRKDFGVVWNEDGDFAFLSKNKDTATRLLQLNVAAHAALGISTYTFSIGAGSDVLYYNTKVASTYGWRVTHYEQIDSSWANRIRNAREAIASGMNAVEVAGKAAKEKGMLFLPSYRMNDSHFMADPYNYPLTGKFWIDNGSRMRIGESPLSFNKDYGNLLDYSHAEVRAFRLNVIKECIELHKNIMDGMELDFNRVQVFFPKEKVIAGMTLMTKLLREIRKILNHVSIEQGRPFYLFVRIPPSIESCLNAGLDIETWMKEGLVDMITPSQLMTLAQDMPIERMINLGKKYSVSVYPSIFPRTSFRKVLQPSLMDAGLDKEYGRIATLSEFSGAIANYHSIGANGFYLYNFKGGEKDEGFRPHPDWLYALVAEMKSPEINTGDKVFFITKTYYHDDESPSYAYVKQIPVKINQSAHFSLLIGEDISASIFPIKSCLLRIGLKRNNHEPFSVQLNGLDLAIYKSFPEKASAKKLPTDLATENFIFLINDIRVLKKGYNDIVIHGNSLEVTDVECGISYFNQLDMLMMGRKAPAINQSFNQ